MSRRSDRRAAAASVRNLLSDKKQIKTTSKKAARTWGGGRDHRPKVRNYLAATLDGLVEKCYGYVMNRVESDGYLRPVVLRCKSPRCIKCAGWLRQNWLAAVEMYEGLEKGKKVEWILGVLTYKPEANHGSWKRGQQDWNRFKAAMQKAGFIDQEMLWMRKIEKSPKGRLHVHVIFEKKMDVERFRRVCSKYWPHGLVLLQDERTKGGGIRYMLSDILGKAVKKLGETVCGAISKSRKMVAIIREYRSIFEAGRPKARWTQAGELDLETAKATARIVRVAAGKVAKSQISEADFDRVAESQLRAAVHFRGAAWEAGWFGTGRSDDRNADAARPYTSRLEAAARRLRDVGRIIERAAGAVREGRPMVGGYPTDREQGRHPANDGYWDGLRAGDARGLPPDVANQARGHDVEAEVRRRDDGGKLYQNVRVFAVHRREYRESWRAA